MTAYVSLERRLLELVKYALSFGLLPLWCLFVMAFAQVARYALDPGVLASIGWAPIEVVQVRVPASLQTLGIPDSLDAWSIAPPLAALGVLVYLGAWLVLLHRWLEQPRGLWGNTLRLISATIQRLPPPWICNLGALLLLVLMAFPWWPALAAIGIILSMALLYPWSESALKRVGLMCALTAIFSACATFFVGSHWIGLALSLVVVSLVVWMCFRMIRHRVRHAAWFLPAVLLPAVFPFFIPICRDALELALLGLLALVVGPFLCGLAINAPHKRALRELRMDLQQSGDAEKSDQSGNRPAGNDDDILKSDGYADYYRLSYSGVGGAPSENGCVARYRPPKDCVAFRFTTLSFHPCVEAVDRIGLLMAKVFLNLVPKMPAPGVIEELYKAIYSGWNVKRLTPERWTLVKLPFDHGSILTVPEHWHGEFVYPHGSGIYDCDGYPCFARQVAVQIRLKKRVLEAIERLESAAHNPSDEDVRLARMLLWNSFRILPGAYEGLLTCLVEIFRDCSLDLFVKHGRGGPRQDKELRGNLNKAWPRRLTPPLAELIDVDVLAIEVDAGLRQEAYDASLRLKELESGFELRRQKAQAELLKHCRAVLEAGEVEGRLSVAKRLTKAQSQLFAEADHAHKSVLEGLKAAQGHVKNNAGTIRTGVAAEMSRFGGTVDKVFKRMFEAWEEVCAIFDEDAGGEAEANDAARD